MDTVNLDTGQVIVPFFMFAIQIPLNPSRIIDNYTTVFVFYRPSLFSNEPLCKHSSTNKVQIFFWFPPLFLVCYEHYSEKMDPKLYKSGHTCLAAEKKPPKSLQAKFNLDSLVWSIKWWQKISCDLSWSLLGLIFTDIIIQKDMLTFIHYCPMVIEHCSFIFLGWLILSSQCFFWLWRTLDRYLSFCFWLIYAWY